MRPPPPYPRTPYLWTPPSGAPDDKVLSPEEAARFLREPVVVEEKLDGANVSLWLDDDGLPQVASRGGPDAMDRAGQLGRLRAWAYEHLGALQTLLADGWAAYGEWLWLRHGVAYDALPDLLVVLDLWHPEHGFAEVDERDRRAQEVGLTPPPRLHDGVLGSAELLQRLLGRPSCFASGTVAEGVVLRRLGGARAKAVADGFQQVYDDAFHQRRRNSSRNLDAIAARRSRSTRANTELR